MTVILYAVLACHPKNAFTLTKRLKKIRHDLSERAYHRAVGPSFEAPFPKHLKEKERLMIRGTRILMGPDAASFSDLIGKLRSCLH